MRHYRQHVRNREVTGLQGVHNQEQESHMKCIPYIKMFALKVAAGHCTNATFTHTAVIICVYLCCQYYQAHCVNSLVPRKIEHHH